MVKVDNSKTTEAATSMELWKENHFGAEQRTDRDLGTAYRPSKILVLQCKVLVSLKHNNRCDYDETFFYITFKQIISYMLLTLTLSSVLSSPGVMSSLHVVQF